MSTDIWSCTCYIIAFAVYLNTLPAEFVYDDRRAILANQDVNSNNAFSHLWYNDFWGTPLASSNSHGSYRPLCVLTFRLNHLLFGYRPLAYHLTNVILHVLSTALVLKLGKCLLPQKAARYGALLFAVHPVHAEAVAGIVGRADVISCVFYLLTVLCYMRHRAESHDEEDAAATTRYSHQLRHKYRVTNQPPDSWVCVSVVRKNAFLVLSVFFGCLAAFCKETGFTALPVCLLYEILQLHRSQLRSWTKTSPHWRNIEVLALSSVTLLMIRVKLSGFHVPTFSAADNPIAKSDFFTRLLTFLYLPVFNFLLFLFPYTLSFDWGMDSVPKISTIFDARNCLSFAFYYLLHIVARTVYARSWASAASGGGVRSSTTSRKTLSKQSAPLFLVLFTVVSFLPASNLFFYVGFVVAERILYIPSVGMCLLIGYGYHIISNRTRSRACSAIFALLILVLGARCVLRNNDWQNEEKLYKSNVGINPPKAYGNLGSVLSDEGRLMEAEVAFRAALKYRFNMADVHYNLAMLLEKTNRADEAVASYNLAIKFRPSLAVAYLKLGQLLTKMNRDEEAKHLFILCSRLDGTGLKDPKLHETAKIEALVNLALIESKNTRYQQALSIYLEAILSAPAYYKSQALYNFVGETFIKMEKYEEAEKWFRYVTGEIEFERHGFLHLNSFANYSDFEPSKWHTVIRKHRTFEDPFIYLQYSELLFDLKKYRKAAEVLRKVVNVMPEDSTLIRKMAHVCKIAGLLGEAEGYYRRVTYLHSDASSFSDLGAILYLRGKYAESEMAYKHSLALNPTDKKIERTLFELKCILYNNRRNSTYLYARQLNRK